MDRRDFLRGALIGTSAAACTALIKLPTPEEVRALVPHEDVFLRQPDFHHQNPLIYDHVGAEVYLKKRNSKEFMPIGFLTEVNLHREVLDGTASWDGQVTLVPGMIRGFARFEGRG
jgi:hypothetical protein